MDKNYFDINERKDYSLLEAFNDKTNVFDKLAQAPVKYYIDASAHTLTKLGEERIFSIELKNRNQVLLDDLTVSGTTSDGKPYTASTIYIESHKVADLLLDYLYYHQDPLYVNFLMDGTVMVHNLARLSERPKYSKEKKIKSKGYEQFEMAKRLELKIEDAAIYKDGKLIHKPKMQRSDK